MRGGEGESSRGGSSRIGNRDLTHDLAKKNLTCPPSPKFPRVTIRDRDLETEGEMKMKDMPVSCKAPIFDFHAAFHSVVR